MYGDTVGNLYLHTRTLREALPVEKALEAYQFFDGLGRAVRSTSRTGESTWAATATEYDGVGRVVRVANPYETSDYSGAVPQSALWATTEYDALGRPWKVTTPDGAKVITHFDGLRTLVTDQSGKQRLSKTDALGRLTEVWEVRSSDAVTGTEAISFPHYADAPDVAAGYRTSYTYDILGNLRKVEQGAQRRYFAYDSLSRLLRVKNPEQDSLAALQLPAGYLSPLSDNNNEWSLKYEYDESGNLKRKTDARGVATDYSYDALNRVTFRNYSDSTPDVTYTFGNDIATNSKGRLLSVSSSVSTYSYTAFDVMGRVTASSQTTGGVTYTMPEYKYDLLGNLTSEEYPSGRVVETQYDAGGRLAGVKNRGGAYYAGGDPEVADNPNVIQYAAHGGVTALRLGNGLWEHTLYNTRLQPYEIGLGASATDSSKLRLEYGYDPTVNGAADPTKNNGNVRSQRISVPAEGATPAQTFAQSYTYDALNRLESASEVKGVSETWRQTYAYDRHGNRTLDEQHTTKLNSAGATVYAVDPSNRAAMNPTVSASTNRVSEAGYSFDAAGNLLCDPSHPCGPAPALTPYFGYDAENQMVRAAGGAQVGCASYAYDGGGKRVRKVADGVTTVFAYDAAGALVAEYGGAQPQAGGVSYLTQDALGSTRAVTGRDGQVRSRHDYLPFGEEVDGLKIANTGREGFTSYSHGTVRQKFTGYERDIESELDYAQARYYNSKHGRFTSVDPLMSSADIANPQTFNRYAYVGNNPINIIDPTGESWGVKDGNVKWFAGDPTDGYEPYNLLYGYIAGTNQMVALNAMTGAVVNVASAGQWLSQQVSWGATAEMLAPGAAALAGVPIAVASMALADALDPAGRWRTGLNLPEPVREARGMSQSYWNEFLSNVNKNSQVLMNENTSEGNSDSADAAKPNQKDNEPTDHAKQRRQEARSGNANRDVGDPNRVVREGRAYRDNETGYTVYVKGNRAVVYDGNRQVTQFKNSRRNTQNRVNSGRWTPLK
jgi:RHS repeat-associated protein